MDRKIGLLIFVLLALSIFAFACTPTPTPPASGKPSIILAAPPHGAEFREGDNVMVQSASGDAAGIARVELSVDGAIVRTDSAPSPQTYFNIVQNWKAAPGTHTISVRAYTVAGVASDPASVSVTILPAAATPVAAPPTATPVAATPSPVAVATAPPSPPSTTAPPTATCADNSELVMEAVPEGTTFAPGQPFDKGWRMKNSGTCAWGQGYAFVFVSGEAMTNDTTVPLADPIASGETADAWMTMSAPTTSGVHQGQWQMRNAQGAQFGAIFKAAINVIAAGSVPGSGAEPPSGAAQTLPTLAPAATLQRGILLLPPGLLTRTPTWTPHPGFGIVPGRTPTWTPHPGFGVAPTRTPTLTGPSGIHSDRNLKSNIATVNPRDVLERLARIPVSTWNYTSDGSAIRHIGTMAQDFYAAFGVGETDTRIMQVDADGVAFAAVQGLHQIVQEKDAQIAVLQKQNAALEVRVAALEQQRGDPAILGPSLLLGAILPWLSIGVVGCIWLLRQKNRRDI